MQMQTQTQTQTPAQAGPAREPDPIAQLTGALLEALGEDLQREGLRRTPQRVAAMYRELTQGYRTDPHALLKDAVFSTDNDSMILANNIEYYSLCEHHLLPFFGRVHVGYIPDGKLIGFSKIPRLVEVFSRRLQLQERLTEQIAAFLQEVLKPRGVGVVAEGFHLCQAMRGIQKQGARLITSSMKGLFRHDARTRAEFLRLIGRGRGE